MQSWQTDVMEVPVPGGLVSWVLGLALVILAAKDRLPPMSGPATGSDGMFHGTLLAAGAILLICHLALGFLLRRLKAGRTAAALALLALEAGALIYLLPRVAA